MTSNAEYGIPHARRAISRIFAAVGASTLCLTLGTVSKAGAQDIVYNYSTELVLASGADFLGLNGATVDVSAEVSSSAIYVKRLGLPIVEMLNDATYTITGSSIAANNGTFALVRQAFIPNSFPGLFTDNTGLTNQFVTLPVGGVLQMVLISNATAHGSAAKTGDTVNILDFAPTTSFSDSWQGSNGESYSESNISITANQTFPGDTPEPGSLALVAGLSLAGLGVFMRRRQSH